MNQNERGMMIRVSEGLRREIIEKTCKAIWESGEVSVVGTWESIHEETRIYVRKNMRRNIETAIKAHLAKKEGKQ